MSIAPIRDSHSTPGALQRTVEARRREWADLAPAQRAEVLERQAAVRHDRKFYTSLALHRAVLQHLRQDPDRVFQIAARNIAAIDGTTRGHAATMMRDWKRLIDDQSVATIERVLTGLSEHDVEMRNLTPFAGVLDDAEHLKIRERVNLERAWER